MGGKGDTGLRKRYERTERERERERENVCVCVCARARACVGERLHVYLLVCNGD